MDSTDIVDDVNTLLKLGVGDSYRLEHIKQAYIQNKTIWITDKNYLLQMKEKYLAKHTFDETTETDEDSKNNPDDKEMIHCWKCGKQGPLDANFCMVCGTSLFEVGTESQPVEVPAPSVRLKNPKKTIRWKISVFVGIPVLILIILGAGYSLVYFDNTLPRAGSDDSKVPDAKTDTAIKNTGSAPSSGQPNSKCGKGTVFDTTTNSCVLDTGSAPSSGQPNSKCGKGTVFDTTTNSCVLDTGDSSSSGQPNSKCGKGTVFDTTTNSCVLDTGDSSSSGQPNSKCGKGTVFDTTTNSCVLDG